jgi:hypothetical protein
MLGKGRPLVGNILCNSVDCGNRLLEPRVWFSGAPYNSAGISGLTSRSIQLICMTLLWGHGAVCYRAPYFKWDKRLSIERNSSSSESRIN